MEEIKNLPGRWFGSGTLPQGTLSSPRRKAPGQAVRVKLKPIVLKNERYYQFAYEVGAKEPHENLPAEPAMEKLVRLHQEQFKQRLMQTKHRAAEPIRSGARCFYP